jgi:hypothetical protein
MPPMPRFTAIAVVDGQRFEVLVHFNKDGSVPRVVDLGSGVHKRRLKKTGKKSQGKWIYREVKRA